MFAALTRDKLLIVVADGFLTGRGACSWSSVGFLSQNCALVASGPREKSDLPRRKAQFGSTFGMQKNRRTPCNSREVGEKILS